MASLTNEQQNVKNIFVRKILNINMLKIRKYHKVEITVIIQGNIKVHHMAYII